MNSFRKVKNILSKMIASMHDENNHITIPGETGYQPTNINYSLVPAWSGPRPSPVSFSPPVLALSSSLDKSLDVDLIVTR